MKAAWIAVVLAAACSKEEPAGEPGAKPAEGGEAEDTKLSEAKQSLLEAWKEAGLAPGAITPAEKGFAKDCAATVVNKVDVVVCELASADEAKAAETKGLAWVGTTTGAAWSAGSLVIAVADRKKADVNGKTINQLMKSTPK